MGLRGLRGFITVLIISTISASAAEKSCDEFLKQFNPPSKQLGGVKTPRIQTHPKLLSPIKGSSTNELYTPDWQVRVKKDGSGYLDFAFIPTAGPSAQPVPVVKVIHSESDNKHIGISIRLSKDSDGAFQDWNLVLRVLEHLFTFAQEEDQFAYIVNDLKIRERLFNALDEALNDLYYIGSRPEPVMKDEAPFSANKDLKLEGLAFSEFKELVSRLNESGIERKLTDAFAETEFGRFLYESGNWRFKIVLDTYEINFPEEEAEEAVYTGPYQLRFRLQLQSNW